MDDVAVTELLSHETMETIVEKLASQFRDELKGKDKEVTKFLKQISKDLGAKVRAFWRSPPCLDCRVHGVFQLCSAAKRGWLPHASQC